MAPTRRIICFDDLLFFDRRAPPRPLAALLDTVGQMTSHLIHVGFPKTGTNFLGAWFDAHPQIAFARRGIAGCRSAHDLVRAAAIDDPRIRCRATLHEALATPHEQAGLTLAERRPRHHPFDPEAQVRARDLLAALFPNAHILVVTRGFRSVLVSGYSQYVRSGGTRDFFALRELEPAEFNAYNDHLWNYDRFIGLYEEVFADRLIVLPYEWLRDDPDAFIREIERRLGLDHHPAPAQRANPSLTPVQLRWYPRITRFLMGLPVGERMRGQIRRFYLPQMKRRPLGAFVSLLQKMRPATPVTADLIQDDLIAPLAGRAERLRANPFYAPYARDYLF